MFCQTQVPAIPPNHTAQILHFPSGRRLSANPERVAEVLLALEAAPLFPPRVYALRRIDGVHQVTVIADGRPFALSPIEARLVADCLWADPVGPGFADVALRFREAAVAAYLGQTRDMRP